MTIFSSATLSLDTRSIIGSPSPSPTFKSKDLPQPKAVPLQLLLASGLRNHISGSCEDSFPDPVTTWRMTTKRTQQSLQVETCKRPEQPLMLHSYGDPCPSPEGTTTAAHFWKLPSGAITQPRSICKCRALDLPAFSSRLGNGGKRSGPAPPTSPAHLSSYLQSVIGGSGGPAPYAWETRAGHCGVEGNAGARRVTLTGCPRWRCRLRSLRALRNTFPAAVENFPQGAHSPAPSSPALPAASHSDPRRACGSAGTPCPPRRRRGGPQGAAGGGGTWRPPTPESAGLGAGNWHAGGGRGGGSLPGSPQGQGPRSSRRGLRDADPASLGMLESKEDPGDLPLYEAHPPLTL
nr:translation initiation factor IF-2-like [Saimiri boliviensis boliviensis]